MKARIAVAVSGSGRSLENLLRHQDVFEVVGVIASNPECRAVTIARAHVLPVLVSEFRPADEKAVASRIEAWLRAHAVEWIALAGFLKKFPVLPDWANRIVNIHPALLPKFGGKGMYGDAVHKAVIGARERESGATVHFVNENYDEGAIIGQVRLDVAPGTQSNDLAAQVFRAECHLYPEVLHSLVRGTAKTPLQWRLTSDGRFQPSPEILFDRFQEYWLAFVEATYGTRDGLAEVMSYVLGGDGKKTRALLTLMFCEATGATWKKACKAACAIEMVHAYSLVHDDLPAMDNDDLRRGRPSAHKKFNESLAILAGDGLLTDAFGLLGRSYFNGGEMCAVVAEAAGSKGMVLGQTMDLEATGKSDAQMDALEVHSLKTGELMGAAAALGVIAADGSAELVRSARLIGRKIGLAFQISDDLLDDQPDTGKTSGKDARSGKLTAVSSLGRPRAEALATQLTDEAITEVEKHFLGYAQLSEFLLQLLKREK